jgi:tRNA (guanine37-N1)-methyltransferase
MSNKRPAKEQCLSLGIVSLFPDMFAALNYGVIGRALDEKRLSLSHFNPRDFSTDPHLRVDDRPYGGGPGMVMCYQPAADAIQAAKAKHPDAHVIHLSPQGQPLTHSKAKKLAQRPSLVLLASRYEGVDQRLIDTHVDEELSVGDFVVSGGELPAMMLIDAIGRFLPGVLGDAESAEQDSFADGMLDHPHYTRPEVIGGSSVPPVLLSGNHAAIAQWRLEKRKKSTWQQRPDLLKRCSPIDTEYAPGSDNSAPLSDKEDKDEK